MFPKIGISQNGWWNWWKTLWTNGWFGGTPIFGNIHIAFINFWVHLFRMSIGQTFEVRFFFSRVSLFEKLDTRTPHHPVGNLPKHQLFNPQIGSKFGDSPTVEEIENSRNQSCFFSVKTSRSQVFWGGFLEEVARGRVKHDIPFLVFRVYVYTYTQRIWIIYNTLIHHFGW